MTWDAFHRRGEVLRAVVEQADARRDGILPLDVPGVTDTFGDALDLIAALQLRWHTRLAGRIEQSLADQPTDPESAVLDGWRATASELAGVRLVLDRALTQPASEEAAATLRRAQDKDWALMAAMAGLAGATDAAAPSVGRELEQRARATFRPVAPARHRADTAAPTSLMGRLKAVLAA